MQSVYNHEKWKIQTIYEKVGDKYNTKYFSEARTLVAIEIGIGKILN